jgi:hypothetical protein
LTRYQLTNTFDGFPHGREDRHGRHPCGHRRSRRAVCSTIALIAAVTIVLLFVVLLFLERSGPSPVKPPVTLLNQTATTTTTTPSAPTTVSGVGNGQNCNDNDQHVGEGTPADIAADMGGGNGTGGDGCPSGI